MTENFFIAALNGTQNWVLTVDADGKPEPIKNIPVDYARAIPEGLNIERLRATKGFVVLDGQDAVDDYFAVREYWALKTTAARYKPVLVDGSPLSCTVHTRLVKNRATLCRLDYNRGTNVLEFFQDEDEARAFAAANAKVLAEVDAKKAEDGAANVAGVAANRAAKSPGGA